MWMLATLPLLASVLLSKETAALGGAESLAIPGYLPIGHVKALKPIGDDRPNDVYEHLEVRGPVLSSDEVVIYPHHYGFEYGQDPENSVYEVHNVKELQAEHAKLHGKKKHSKHNKHGDNHSGNDHHHHHHEQEHHNQIHEVESPSNTQSSYAVPPAPQQQQQQQQQQQFRPRPAHPPVHPHFG